MLRTLATMSSWATVAVAFLVMMGHELCDVGKASAFMMATNKRTSSVSTLQSSLGTYLDSIAPETPPAAGEAKKNWSLTSWTPPSASSSSSAIILDAPLYTAPPTVAEAAPLAHAGSAAAAAISTATTTTTTTDPSSLFAHMSRSAFDVSQLTPKGPRANADVGQPHDSSRKMTSMESAAGHDLSSGSWWCAAGGWPSLNPRPTTEIFMVFSGHGKVTDLDGMEHYFGPGDTVVLPKGWSGRWDVLQDIHKVWFVYDHPHVEEHDPVRASITPYHNLMPSHLQHLHPVQPNSGNVNNMMLKTNPTATTPSSTIASSTIYDVGPTTVGSWTCSPGSFPVTNLARVEGFHVLEGTFFLSNVDGSATRCVAGDTVMIPQGWSGHWDVLETVRTLAVVVE